MKTHVAQPSPAQIVMAGLNPTELSSRLKDGAGQLANLGVIDVAAKIKVSHSFAELTVTPFSTSQCEMNVRLIRSSMLIYLLLELGTRET